MPAPFGSLAGGEPQAELAPAPEPTVDAEPDPMLPTMTDLRSVATDLDDIDEILARLDDDESAPDDEMHADTGPSGQGEPSVQDGASMHDGASVDDGGMPASIADPMASDDPEDQDPLLATR